MSENKISERKGSIFSRRASQGKLDIINSRCPNCGHHKAFYTTDMGKKCTKCKMRY